MRRVWPICVLLAAGGPADAGGLVINAASPRSIGRAGTGVVGDDGSGALLANPAAMARREGTRAQLGLAFIDDELAWQSTTEGAPVARDQAASNLAPHFAGFATFGSWTFGVGVMTSAVSDRTLRPPRDIPSPGDFGTAFEYRYLGIAGAVRRDTVTVGVARRVGDSVAVGVAFGASRVQLLEVRRMWAGFSAIADIGSPEHDLEVGFSGEDPFAPSAVAGVLFAPEDTSLELGASVAWADTAHVEADIFAAGTRPEGPSERLVDGAIATFDLKQPITARAGARYLGDRFVVEIGGEVAFVPRAAADNAWRVFGMSVSPKMGDAVPIPEVPSRISLRTHGTVRGAVDAELLAGFLWATAGYAYSVGSVNDTKQSPTFGDLGGHTAALGFEGTAGGFTLTLGWSRTWANARTVTESSYALDNPFRAGDRTIPGGSYDGSVDQIGIQLDAEVDFGK